MKVVGSSGFGYEINLGSNPTSEKLGESHFSELHIPLLLNGRDAVFGIELGCILNDMLCS